MNEQHPNSLPDDPLKSDELLSAYVDGELTDQELAEVEQRLANDPQAQQLVDEIRALSQQVQSLPRQSISEDLRATIMRRAEREMLLGNQPQKSLPQKESGNHRRWVWAALAVAATLLLSLVLPNAQQDEKPLASAEPVPEAQEPTATQADAEAVPVEPEAMILARDKSLPEPSSDELQGEPSVENLQVAEALTASQAAERARQADALAKSAPPEPSFSAARSRAPLSAGGGAGGRKADAIFPLTCEVHITLGDGQNSIAQVDRFMLQNGITRSDAKGVAGGSDERDVVSEQVARPAQPRDAEQADVAASYESFAKLILVEAPLENVERTLQACNVDEFHCQTIRVVEETQPPTTPVARLRQWERSVEQPTEDKFAEDETALAETPAFEFRRSSTSQLERRNASGVERGNGALSSRAAQSAQSNATDVRVLFVLQQAADLRKPLRVESETDSPPER